MGAITFLRQSSGSKPRLILRDAPDQSGGIGVNGERKQRFKVKVALDSQTEWQLHALNLGKADRTELGRTKSQIGKTEQCVAIGAQFRQQPRGCANRIEQFNNRNMVAAIFAVGE